LDITAILDSEKGVEKIMGDILRVLYLYRRLWLIEICMEIEGMNTTLKNEVPSYDDVVNAAKELEKTGLIKLEKRLRSSLSHASGVEDYLVSLNEDPELLRALSIDDKLIEYMRIRDKLLKFKN